MYMKIKVSHTEIMRFLQSKLNLNSIHFILGKKFFEVLK